MDETFSQARAAAGRVCIIISSDKYLSVANIASRDEDVCAGYGMCVSVCPYSALSLIWKNRRQVWLAVPQSAPPVLWSSWVTAKDKSSDKHKEDLLARVKSFLKL